VQRRELVRLIQPHTPEPGTVVPGSGSGTDWAFLMKNFPLGLGEFAAEAPASSFPKPHAEATGVSMRAMI